MKSLVQLGSFLVLGSLVGAACFKAPASSAGDIEKSQRDAMAQSMGNPTHKSPAELDATIAKLTDGYQQTDERFDGSLAAPAPVSLEAHRGACYTLVMHLGAGATWGDGAEAGLKFDYQGAGGSGSAGPGVVGPGAVAALACAEQDGPITVTMTPMIGQAPIGTGPYELAVYSRTATEEELAHLQADKQQQIDEQKAAAERDAAAKREKQQRGCTTCEARYQGCIGAGIQRATCQDKFRTCAFEEVGAEWMDACPAPTH